MPDVIPTAPIAPTAPAAGTPDQNALLLAGMTNLSAMDRQMARQKAHSDFLRQQLNQPASGRSPINIGTAILNGLRYGYDRRQQEKRDAEYAQGIKGNTQLMMDAYMRRGQFAPQPPAAAPNVIEQPAPDVIP